MYLWEHFYKIEVIFFFPSQWPKFLVLIHKFIMLNMHDILEVCHFYNPKYSSLKSFKGILEINLWISIY